jgi:hypothetical protein
VSAHPYDDLVALAEIELELARNGDYAALAPVQRAWRTLTATLPHRAPLVAAAQLKRAAALNSDAQRLLRERAELARDRMRQIEQGRRALDGYAQPAEPRVRVNASG